MAVSVDFCSLWPPGFLLFLKLQVRLLTPFATHSVSIMVKACPNS